MKKIALLAALIAAIALMTGCKKDTPVDPPIDTPTETPTDTPDPYETFKADATSRWENDTTVEKHEESDHTFIIDEGGYLFSSDRYKVGRLSADGSDYELIEFSGTPAVGTPADPTLRKPSGTAALHSLEIVQITDGKLWIIFQETENATERRIVQ